MKEMGREGKVVVGTSFTPVLASGGLKPTPFRPPTVRGACDSQDWCPLQGWGYSLLLGVCEEPSHSEHSGWAWGWAQQEFPGTPQWQPPLLEA